LGQLLAHVPRPGGHHGKVRPASQKAAHLAQEAHVLGRGAGAACRPVTLGACGMHDARGHRGWHTHSGVACSILSGVLVDGGWRHELEHGGRKALGKVEVTESHRSGGAMWMRQRWSFTSALVGGGSDSEIGGGSDVLLQLQGVEGR
jgi:hypothetical protein